MGWENISGFLDRFKTFKPPKEFLLEESIKVLREVLGIEIKQEEIEIRNNVLYLIIKNPAFKNEIFLKKDLILKKLKKKIGYQAPIDLRF